MMYKRRFITLVELLLVITLILITSGVIGINVSRALREQHFRTEVERVVNQLRLAQELMLLLHGNIHVRFTKQPSDSGFILSIQFDNALPNLWAEELQRTQIPLSYIRVIEFETEQPNHSPLASEYYGDVNTFDLEFLSGGSKMSIGVLRLATTAYESGDRGLERYVILPGYPAPIVEIAEHPSKDFLKVDSRFENELTHKTLEELREEPASHHMEKLNETH